MDSVKPRDTHEAAAAGLAGVIIRGIGIAGAALASAAAMLGGLDWLKDNIPLLATGLCALATGGLTSYIAVRRMRVDRAGALLLLALPLVTPGCMTSGQSFRIPITADDGTVYMAEGRMAKNVVLAKDAMRADSITMSPDTGYSASGLSQRTDASALIELGKEVVSQAGGIAKEYLKSRGVAAGQAAAPPKPAEPPDGCGDCEP